MGIHFRQLRGAANNRFLSPSSAVRLVSLAEGHTLSVSLRRARLQNVLSQSIQSNLCWQSGNKVARPLGPQYVHPLGLYKQRYFIFAHCVKSDAVSSVLEATSSNLQSHSEKAPQS